MAREISPLVAKIANNSLDMLNLTFNTDSAKILIKILSSWDGNMSEESIGATVFSTWQLFFY
jgi:hypothetical protein